MRIFKKIILWFIGVFILLYTAVCAFFYFYQEHIIFPGRVVMASHHYNFPLPYHQYSIKTADGNIVDGYLFKSPYPTKGLVFYLHGNADNVQTWSDNITNYTNLGYDAFVMDYPGYGKSTGHISSLNQFFNSIKTAYDTVKKGYPEGNIIIMGYSIGTGPAAWLAAQTHPKMLLLLAPYYSLSDMALKRYPFLPGFLLKYPINTYQYIQHVTVPIIIFHGDRDQVVYYGSSLKLKPYLKPGDTLITLKGHDHFHFDEEPVYMGDVTKILR